MPWPTTSRHKRGYGTAWNKLRFRILARDKHLCQPCMRKGRVRPASHVDHIIAKAKGGTDDEGNLQAICTACHKDKTTVENGGRVKPKIGADGWPLD